MKKYLPYILIFLFTEINAQNINVDKGLNDDYAVKLTGGLNLNSSFNSYFLSNKLNLFASGNLNLNINQFNIPVNFNYSDRKFNFSQAYSFNQLSIRPTYKWASATVGTGNYTFSPYTLNGHQFLGAGLELKPNKWNVKLMYGRLQKASPLDSVAGHTYRRIGAGTKISYRFNDQLQLGLTSFYAKDIQNSIPSENQLFYDQTLNPQENLVLSVDFIIKPLSFIEWKGEIANSLITTNTFANVRTKFNSPSALFLNENSSSRSLNAFKTALNFRLGSSSSLMGLAYERVDPDYRTLGGYYFVNDLENYSLQLSSNFLNDKLSFFARLGVQKDDLNQTKSVSQSRWVGSLNSTIKPNENLNINLGYSNFTSYQFVKDTYQEITRIPGQPIDSLDYSQISQNINAGLSQILLNTEKVNSSLSFNLSTVKAQGRNGPIIRSETTSDILNATLFYNHGYLLKNLGLSAGFSFNQNSNNLGKTKGFGPSLSIQKDFLESKLTTSLTSSILFSEFNAEQLTASNIYLNTSYSPFQRHKLSFNLGLVDNGFGSVYTNANLGYNLSF